MFGRLTPVVKNLLIINITLLVINQFGILPLNDWFGLRYIFSEQFMVPQIFVHMFLHGGFAHLFFNMFALFIFGPLLEQFLGSKRFLQLYLITGLGAAFLFSAVEYVEISQIENAREDYIENPNPEDFNKIITEHDIMLTRMRPAISAQELYSLRDRFSENPDNSAYIKQTKQYVNEIYKRKANIPMVGASGAIFGILIAFGLLFPNTELMLLFFPMPIKAKYLVTFYAILEIWQGINQSPGDNIAHFAHIGGMLFGFILIKYWQRSSNRFY